MAQQRGDGVPQRRRVESGRAQHHQFRPQLPAARRRRHQQLRVDRLQQALRRRIHLQAAGVSPPPRSQLNTRLDSVSETEIDWFFLFLFY